MNYQQVEQEQIRLKNALEEIERKKKAMESLPEFKDNKIKELEKRIVSLEKELEPHRRKAEQKRIDDYGNQKCTDKLGCGCRTCNDL